MPTAIHNPLKHHECPTQSAAAVSQQSAAAHQQQWFLTNWRTVVYPKLQQLVTLLGGQEVSRNLALAQVWTYLPVLLEGRQSLKADPLCLLGTPELQAFHTSCAELGVPVHLLGPMGKAWESGVVKVVQSLENLSRETHPCNRLQGGLASHVEEVIYIPVYDRGPCAASGVVAVLELLVSSQAHDYMVVANAISCTAQLMEGLQLSVSNPLAPPHPHQVAGAQAKAEAEAAATRHPAHCAAQQQQQLQAHQRQLAPLAGPPTAPSSPTAAAVPTPTASPPTASPFAAASSPFDSPTKQRCPAPRGQGGAQFSAEELARTAGKFAAGAVGGSGGAGQLPQQRSVPAPGHGLPPAGRAASASELPSWPGASWVAPAPPAAPRPASEGSGSAGDLARGAGGLGRRSLSRSTSFRRNLNETQLMLSELMSDD